jgi:hypothetical protein
MGSNVAPISSKNRVSRRFDGLLHPHPSSAIIGSRWRTSLFRMVGAGADRIADALFGQAPAWLWHPFRASTE